MGGVATHLGWVTDVVVGYRDDQIMSQLVGNGVTVDASMSNMLGMGG
jgi:hypothetical protein